VRHWEKLESTEYRLNFRMDRIKGVPASGKSQWMDASGWNNPQGIYADLSQVRAQMTRCKKMWKNSYTGVEFEILERQVTRTTWKEHNPDV
jgi:hypothetical protein